MLERKVYIKLVYMNYLNDKETYHKIDSETANALLTKTKNLLCRIINEGIKKYNLKKHEITYLKRMIQRKWRRIAQMYNIIKIHKITVDTKIILSRPVLSIPSTILSPASTFANHLLQQLVPYVTSYIEDTFTLVKEIDELSTLLPGSKIFTADAISAYTNIDTKHCINIMKNWIFNLNEQNKLPLNFPVNMFIDLLHLIMTHNLFQFGNNYFVQINAYLIGVNCAVNYMTLYFGYKEEFELLPTYFNSLFFYKQQVNDILGLWKGNLNDFENLKKTLTILDYLSGIFLHYLLRLTS